MKNKLTITFTNNNTKKAFIKILRDEVDILDALTWYVEKGVNVEDIDFSKAYSHNIIKVKGN